MDYFFAEVKDKMIAALQELFGGQPYLMKGGQALALHLNRANAQKYARFSKDIDFSFPASFPYDPKQIGAAYMQLYNSHAKDDRLLINAASAEKLPQDRNVYFGIRMSVSFGKRKVGGVSHHKEFLTDIESPVVIIDCTCNEYVDDVVVVSFGGVRTATISLIVAEKFRALCSNLYDPKANTFPRPKDFYDLFVIYVVLFNRQPNQSVLKEIKDLLQKCFDKKAMPLSLLDSLDSDKQKAFHSRNFAEQVTDTLESGGRFSSVTFDQTYSDTLEFLGKIRAS
jgi:hypothetical protein